ncbi:DoxX family membrane protein [Cellulosimicrobium terreum]|nr:DoxX family membrane protein [Cellulosimicrobium terreum]
MERRAATPLPTVGSTQPDGLDLAQRAGRPTQVVLGVLRIALGFYFLWAFLDKTFGLGFATPADKAWVQGGSPTTGFLSGVEGPFSGFFNGIAGAAWADWLFMAGLLGIGLALVLGIGMRIAAVCGSALLVLMYLAALPLETNPIIDDHLTMALTIVALALLGAGSVLGLGSTWKRLPVVRNNRWLV